MAALEAEIVQYASLENSAALALNPRQISFVDNYIECKVLWKAAELAGYAGNRNTLHSVAWENMQKPAIRAYYEERLAAIQVSHSEVLAEIGELARYNLADMGKDCVVRPVDKLKALELAGKYHKLWDRNEVEVSFSEQDAVRIGESLFNVMLEAAQRKRLEAQRVVVAGEGDNNG